MKTTTRKIRQGEKAKGGRGDCHRYKILFLLGIVSCVIGCAANEKVLRSGSETPTPAPTKANDATPAKVPFARDLEDMRTAGFAFVYVLRRKDGGKIDAEDRGFIRFQTADANRRELADESRAVIVGSNFQIPAANMKALYGRFAIENYSPPPAANANTNTNK
jgi:hypothetical protein